MICENCGKEHDGSYGSGRFCSKHCRLSFIGKQANKNGKLFGHKQYNTDSTCFKPKEGGWTCSTCGLILATRRKLIDHRHKEHSVEITHYIIGEDGRRHLIGTPWNKGKTKENCEGVAKYAKSYSDNIKSGKTKQADHKLCWTEELRKQQSEIKKKLYAEHPEKHPNRKLAFNRSKMTYPEQITFDWLNNHGIKNEHNYHFVTDKFNRYVDFYLPEFNMFIEVDGEYWHKDIQKDIDKDNDALNYGIKTIRIKPKLNVIKQLEDAIMSRGSGV